MMSVFFRGPSCTIMLWGRWVGVGVSSILTTQVGAYVCECTALLAEQ